MVKIYSINPLTGTGCVERDFQQLLKNHLIGWDGKPENGLKSNNNKFQSPIEHNLLFTMQSPLCIKLYRVATVFAGQNRKRMLALELETVS